MTITITNITVAILQKIKVLTKIKTAITKTTITIPTMTKTTITSSLMKLSTCLQNVTKYNLHIYTSCFKWPWVMQVKYFICYLQIPHILLLSEHKFCYNILSLLCLLPPEQKYNVMIICQQKADG